MGFGSRDIFEARTRSHPPASVRISMILSTLETLLIYYKIEKIDSIMKAGYSAIDLAERTFSTMTYIDTADAFVKDPGLVEEYRKQLKFDGKMFIDISKSFSFINGIFMPYTIIKKD